MSDNNFSKARQELQDLYISSFPQKIAIFKAQLEILQQPDEPDLEELRFAAHKIAGSAGSYGFPEISDLARAIDSSIKKKKILAPDLEALTKSLIEVLEKHISE